MLFALVGSTLYKLLFLGHIVSFLVAFAPAVVAPVLTARAKRDGEDVLIKVGGYLAANGRQIHLPGLIALGGFGIGLVLESGVWDFGDAWVSLAFLLWLAMGGVVSAVIIPAERKLADGDLAQERKVAMGGQITTVLLVIVLCLMIWKPGA